MTFGEKLYQYLSENETLEELVNDRIYPNIAPNDTETPYLIYALVSDVPLYTLEGNTKGSIRRVQISIYATDYIDAEELAEVITNAMDEWSLNDNEVQTITKLNQIDRYENETSLYGKILDFSVFY